MSKIQTWLVIAVAAVIAVGAAGWFLMISPQKSKVSSLKAQTASQQQANQSLRSQIDVLKKQQAQLPAEQARIVAIHGKIPDSPALPGYIRFLTKAAAATHVELVSVAPSAPAQVKLAAAPAAGSGATASKPGQGATATGPQNLSAITLNVTVNGDYFAVEQFLSQLQQADRATVVSNIALQPGALPKPQSQGGGPATAGGGQASWQTLQAQITAAIFLTSPTTGAAIAPGSTAAGTAGSAKTAAPAQATTPAANN